MPAFLVETMHKKLGVFRAFIVKGKDMTIVEVKEDKKQYLELLLLADEEERMIDRYLERGKLFVLKDPEVKTICVVTDEGNGVAEIKNLATAPSAQRQGYGRTMVEHVKAICREHFRTLRVGTGESPMTLSFYEACGFRRTGVIENFFTEHYPHPIIEAGVQLRDMVVLEQKLR